ncbi:translation elongation factor G, putative [Perkinsus marinus ATCC 50983]|uniref:Elongation factor G, mitochondrial n=2 Tax=Perkinsus marinus (strain ATCC 50983 / TXsc) TaxID=423536 RepID=C5KH54_PERM5|nr:translation elongation factor G, putative [Perkinsus marinus ATCC 50983]EER15916.1 translation elongation factor G, putative [Perkinsus marinus ATCC 50983]|eukprot:XP_002784120.1 translation elongation factor G, putative [Perkinsus marinus ATCC 50983]
MVFWNATAIDLDNIRSLLEELRGSVDKLHVAMLLRELSKMIRTNAEWIVEGPIVAEVILQHGLSKYPHALEVSIPVCEIFRHYALIPSMRVFFLETAVDAPYISVLTRLASGNMVHPHKANPRLVIEVLAFLANLSSGAANCDMGAWAALDVGARELAKRAFRVFPSNLAVHEQYRVRNIGISAHVDSGKTTLTERVLFYTGRIDDIHEIQGGDGVGCKMDHMELEREKGITITSAATYCQWKTKDKDDYHINIIDTPGHVDFTFEVERSLRVLDGAVMVVCAIGCVQSQTVTVDRQMQRYEVPRIIFINKLDRYGSEPYTALKQLKTKLGLCAALTQIPLGAEDKFAGVVDVIRREAHHFEGYKGLSWNTGEVPSKMLEQVEETRKTLVELMADLDDELAESFLIDENVSAEELERAIRRQTISRRFCPVLLGSAYKNKGVQPLLDAVCKYLPSPGDRVYSGYDQSRNGERVEITPDEKKPFLGMAFKSQDLPPNGTLTYMRVYQGTLKRGQSVLDTKTNKRQSIKKLLRLHSSETREVASAGPGDIVACTGLDVFSGVTCTDGKINWTMSPLHIPAPVVSLSITPASREDSTKMAKALARFKREDPTFIVSTDPGTKETIVSGMGELHLFIYAERIRREYHANVTTGEPRVNFRETINERVAFDYTHKRQSGGRGQYGKVTGYFEPLSHDEVQEILTKYQGEITPMNASKYLAIFQNKIRGNEIPKNFIAYIEKGFRECLEEGPLTGSAVCNLRIVLEGGKHHEVDSSEVAFKAAAQGAFEQAFYGGSPTILQPVMNVEVTVPTDKTGSLMSGITVRKGLVTGSEALTDLDTLVRAKVPLRNMFGFTTELRSITQGHGEWAMDFHAYEEMPADDQESVKKQYVQRRAREKKLEE